MHQYNPQVGGINTSLLAKQLGMSPASIRVHLCTRGDFYGVKPSKMPTGRLVWPADSAEKILEQKLTERATDPFGGAAA